MQLPQCFNLPGCYLVNIDRESDTESRKGGRGLLDLQKRKKISLLSLSLSPSPSLFPSPPLIKIPRSDSQIALLSTRSGRQGKEEGRGSCEPIRTKNIELGRACCAWHSKAGTVNNFTAHLSLFAAHTVLEHPP